MFRLESPSQPLSFPFAYTPGPRIHRARLSNDPLVRQMRQQFEKNIAQHTGKVATLGAILDAHLGMFGMVLIDYDDGPWAHALFFDRGVAGLTRQRTSVTMRNNSVNASLGATGRIDASCIPKRFHPTNC